MLLRTFVVADTSDYGLACYRWCQFLIALDEPVRFAGLGSAGSMVDLVPAKPGMPANPWSELRDYFATPLEAEYVNIVMTPMNTWDSRWSAGARRNVAIVPVDLDLNELLNAKMTRSYNAVVYGGEGRNNRAHALSAKQWGAQVAISPLAANLEDFRAVALP